MAANNTLIVYASRRGDEEKCAREIFNLIDGKVDICDLSNRESFPDASTYDTVIIGSSVYHGKVLELVSNFCRINLDILTRKRLGLFIICPDSGERAEKELQEAYPPELFNSAIARDYFGGEIDPSRLSILEKIITYRLSGSRKPSIPASREKIKKFAKKMNPSHAFQE